VVACRGGPPARSAGKLDDNPDGAADRPDGVTLMPTLGWLALAVLCWLCCGVLPPPVGGAGGPLWVVLVLVLVLGSVDLDRGLGYCMALACPPTRRDKRGAPGPGRRGGEGRAREAEPERNQGGPFSFSFVEPANSTRERPTGKRGGSPFAWPLEPSGRARPRGGLVGGRGPLNTSDEHSNGVAMQLRWVVVSIRGMPTPQPRRTGAQPERHAWSR